MRLNKRIKSAITNQLFLNRLVFTVLLLVTLLSAVFLYDNPTLASSALLFFSVYLITQTYFENKIYSAAKGLKVQDVMIEKGALTILSHATSVEKAIEVIGRSYQQVFPVYYNEKFLGIIRRDYFITTIGSKTDYNYIADFVEKHFDFVYSDESLENVLSRGVLKKAGNIVVLDTHDQFAGVVSYDKLVEYLLIGRVFKESRKRELQDEFWL